MLRQQLSEQEEKQNHQRGDEDGDEDEIDDGVSIEHDDVEDDSELSFDSEYDEEEDDDDDDDEEEIYAADDDDDLDDDIDEEGQSNPSNICFGKRKTSNNNSNKRRQKRRYSYDSTIVTNDGESNGDEDVLSNSNSRWGEMFHPILAPIQKVYKVAKDAIILVTNVDDVWDSPALERRDLNEEIEYNPTSSYDSTAISSTILNKNTNNHDQSSVIGGGITRREAQTPRWNQWNHEQERLLRRDNKQTTSSVLDHLPSILGESSHGGGNIHHFTPATNMNIEKYVSWRHKVGVMFWFLVLAIAYASERSTFKVMVDRMGPFRMVVGAEFVMAIHGMILAVWLLLRKIIYGKDSVKGTVMLPWTDVGVMAILDSIHLLLAVISGSRVAPVLTAVLVHFTIPVYTLMKDLSYKNNTQGSNADSNSQVGNTSLTSQNLFGSTLILISSILALSPAILTLIYPAFFSSKNVMANRTAWNTLLFSTSCIPAALSQTYKERTLTEFAQPVDSALLNMLLSLFSFAFTFLISPLVFSLQGFADMPSTPEEGSVLKVASWIHQYPSKEISINFAESVQCFTGTLSDDIQIRGYPEEALCDFAYGFVLVYVFSILTINHAVDKICNAGAIKIMHRGISAGIIMSVVMMTYYQIFVDDEEYGLLPNFYHVSCAAVLVFGSEVYHRVNLEKPSFETEYRQIGDLYDDDDDDDEGV